MTAAAVVNLIVALITGLGPVIQKLLAGTATPEQAKAEAYAALDAFLADLAALRSQVAADDEAALDEAMAGIGAKKPPAERGAAEVHPLPVEGNAEVTNGGSGPTESYSLPSWHPLYTPNDT